MNSHAGSSELSSGTQAPSTPASLAAQVSSFFAAHPAAVVREDGKVVFAMDAAQFRVSSDQDVCLLELWSEDRTLARRIVGATPRGATLRLETSRLGHAQNKLLELLPEAKRRERTAREAERRKYQELLTRVLRRSLPDWQPDGLRSAMDLERSFGPAYVRGTLVRQAAGKPSQDAAALIGVGASETQNTIDGILTPGILWLDHLRTSGTGRRVYRGLMLIVPRGTGALTQSRLRWLNPAMAEWRLFELDPIEEELFELDAMDQGNLRTRLIHAPDEQGAEERFREAVAAVLAMVPDGEQRRVETRLRSSAEMAFLLHGLTFARAELEPIPGRFAHRVRVFIGVGPGERELDEGNRAMLQADIADLFRRRDPALGPGVKGRRPSLRGAIGASGAFTGKAVHARLRHPLEQVPHRVAEDPEARHERVDRTRRIAAAQRDPLFRAAPERWLESILRANLSPLTRGLAPQPLAPLAPPPGASSGLARRRQLLADARGGVHRAVPDSDSVGNRAESSASEEAPGAAASTASILPRLDPRHVYAQVPAIAGAGDRGMLDLLGVTADGRLAVLELKASDDLHHALQALDYWIRVRHHHREHIDPHTGTRTGEGELQRHGYFRGLELSPLPPRLYLVAPALHIHPATEIVLRYFDPAVEWTLIALDERWRGEIRVVWRRSGGRASATA